MSEILNLNPKELWANFYALTQIPRPSKHEEKVVAYLVEFAKKHNLEYKVDEVGNIIMRKPATKGMENRKGVILQAHVDMVPQKN
ncbi:MAG: cytosol nonspecific dipeptidase, partial [Bacteroidales bacterium]|nr:cytosol nonspecific dipeptidase [Bacteroidales bacterium]